MALNRHALKAAGSAAAFWDDVRYRAKSRLGMVSPPILLPYRGYVANGHIRFGGRVIEDEGIVSAPVSRSRWTNLKQSFRRYETDEIPGAIIEWKALGRSGTATSDKQGFFDVDVPVGDVPEGRAWVPVDMVLTSAPRYEFAALEATTHVRIVSPDAEFGVVSDIDDTIVETGARKLLRHWRTVAQSSAEGRVAFPGLDYFFRALADGRQGSETNPFFYVSSSPWNLYDLFENFLGLRSIPYGPMFLRDFGLTRTQWLSGSHHRHKLGAIRTILDAHPELDFVLIGDTGQSDAKVYAQAVADHPGRIRAVFLRDVTPRGFRAGVQKAIDEIARAGVPVVSGPTLNTAARKAEDLGLVASQTADRMDKQIAEDRERLEGSKRPRPTGLRRDRAAPETESKGD
ncbi:App1 family protein [Paracoccus liaowanqingii]|nr:phosphatase domain-containing protein [Paracoccus liaowanqingii]